MGDSWERVIQRVAWTRDGVVTRRALLTDGVPASVVDRLITSGFLTPIHRGVFAVGWPMPTDRGAWRAAVAAGGEGAALSHRTAGALFGVAPPRRSPIHVTVPSRRRTVPGISWHVSPVPDRSATVRDGFPCVTLARALVEIAGTDGKIAVERAWGRAASANLLRPKDLTFEVSRGRGTPGVGLVRELLASHDGYLVQRSKSDLERAALRLLKTHRVPRPGERRRECASVRGVGSPQFGSAILWRLMADGVHRQPGPRWQPAPARGASVATPFFGTFARPRAGNVPKNEWSRSGHPGHPQRRPSSLPAATPPRFHQTEHAVCGPWST